MQITWNNKQLQFSDKSVKFVAVEAEPADGTVWSPDVRVKNPLFQAHVVVRVTAGQLRQQVSLAKFHQADGAIELGAAASFEREILQQLAFFVPWDSGVVVDVFLQLRQVDQHRVELVVPLALQVQLLARLVQKLLHLLHAFRPRRVVVGFLNSQNQVGGVLPNAQVETVLRGFTFSEADYFVNGLVEVVQDGEDLRVVNDFKTVTERIDHFTFINICSFKTIFFQ